MLNFKNISKIFSDFINKQCKDCKYADSLDKLIWLNIKTNKILWDLEDSARLSELGDKHVSDTKREIDRNNQIRSDLIREIDTEVVNRMDILPGPQEKFYSESPGMIIDRLAIMFLKLSVIQDLLSVITEDDLKKEYEKKESIILGQTDHIGGFLNSYFSKLDSKDVFFEIQQPVKIYNDARIKKYIKSLKQNGQTW